MYHHAMHILLIEDDSEAAAWLVKGLEESGYVVDHAADGEEGLHLARLEALGRRTQKMAVPLHLQVDDLEMDLNTHKVIRSGREIRLQPKEFQLLEYLLRHAGQVVTRSMLLEPGMGFSLRPADERHRHPDFPPAQQDRQGFRQAAAAYHSWQGVSPQCIAIDYCAPRQSGWRCATRFFTAC
jgi:CheY-like chemotaxis protein